MPIISTHFPCFIGRHFNTVVVVFLSIFLRFAESVKTHDTPSLINHLLYRSWIECASANTNVCARTLGSDSCTLCTVHEPYKIIYCNNTKNQPLLPTVVPTGGTVTIHNDQLKQVKLFAVGPDGDFESTVGIAIRPTTYFQPTTFDSRQVSMVQPTYDIIVLKATEIISPRGCAHPRENIWSQTKDNNKHNFTHKRLLSGLWEPCSGKVWRGLFVWKGPCVPSGGPAAATRPCPTPLCPTGNDRS